ncbi:MAG: magnesium transporter [Zetaproteobacteria bacterium]|nr:MAG: magnesium transporter [Zetaproteobacteria bacterium]
MRQDREQRSLSAEEAVALARRDPVGLRRRFAGMHTADIAELLLDCATNDERLLLLRYIPDEKQGDVLLDLPEGMQETLLASLHPEAIGDVVEHLDSDDATDLLQAVDRSVADEVIGQLEPEEQREIKPLLGYDEESAGGLMQAELFKVRADWSAGRVLKVLRRWGREIGNLHYIYVVDDDDRLVGLLSLHDLLFLEPDQPVLDAAERNFVTVTPQQDQETVAQLFDKYDLLAVPVVDERGVLVGRITADDIIDVVNEEATEDMFRLAALSDQDDLSEPVSRTAWRRGVWLLVNLVTAILASTVIAQFQQTISRVVALAVLMPIVASMGGIAGTQTLTVIVRGIALGRVTLANAGRALVKEVLVSVVTGTFFALLMGVVALFWFPALGMKLGVVIAAAMLINLLAAGLAGALIPLTLQRLHIDPALASGTVLTTVTDVVGFFAFLGLASRILL